jgi:hypothetical protein
MPLAALIDESPAVASIIADEEWAELKEKARLRKVSITLPCCGNGAFQRVSSLGTKHFVHKKLGGCTSGRETAQHLWAKAEILAACLEAGWEARPEVAGDRWRADVLAERGKARIAFEVQWSKQDDEVSLARQERYRESGVRGCWFVRTPPPTPGRKELPIFRVREDEQEVVVVEHAGATYPLRTFVAHLLAGQVRFSPLMTAKLQVSFIEVDCWNCKKAGWHIYTVSHFSRCGHEVGYRLSRGQSEEIDDELSPAIVAIIKRWLEGEGRGSGFVLGEIKPRFSRTEGRSYMSFGCPHCDRIFGRFFIPHTIIEAHLEDAVEVGFEFDAPMRGDEDGQGHWCLPPDGVSYCDSVRQPS